MGSAYSKEPFRLNSSPDNPFRPIPQGQSQSEFGAIHSLEQAQEQLDHLQRQQAQLQVQNHQLEASRNRYACYYDLSPVAYFTLNEQGLIVACNQSVTGLLGYEREGLLGQAFMQLVSPGDQAAFSSYFGQLSQGERKASCQLEVRTQGGETRSLRLEGSKLETEGERIEYLLVALDLTGQEQGVSSRGEAHWQKAMSIQTVGVIFFDLEGGINDANAAFERMSGYTKEEFTSGKVRWDVLTPPEFMAVTLKSREEFLTKGENTPYQKQYIRPDGSRWWGLFAGKRLSESECVEFVLDITESKRAEAALQESETRFRTMADAVPQIVWLTDPEGRVEFFNKQWTLYTGADYEPTTAAQVAASFVHPEDGAATMEAFEQARQTGRTFLVEHRIRSAAGAYRWFLVRAEPYRDADTGRIIHWFGASIDIHDHKLAQQALQESEQRFRTMAEASGILVAHTDRAGNAIYFNQEWMKLTGRTQEELIEYGWADFFHPEDRESFVAEYQQAFAQRKVLRREFRLKNQQGDYCWQLAVVSPRFSPDGSFAGFISSCIDITPQKMAESQLQQLSRQLASANGELRAANGELSQANGRLSRVNSDLDNFIYTASHDLKAPILNIEGLLKILHRKVTLLAPQDEQLTHMLTLMDASVNRFKETISDLTDIARIQKQLDGESEPVALGEIVEDTLLDLREQVAEAGAVIEQHLDGCPKALFPRKNLKSVVYNLISNALKYRDPARRPLINISCRLEGDYLVLQVEDNGLGMDTRDESKIFGMFKRLHSHVEGSGVGLYIVRKMIENAGGRIQVESKVGVGSTFRVYFKR